MHTKQESVLNYFDYTQTKQAFIFIEVAPVSMPYCLPSLLTTA